MEAAHPFGLYTTRIIWSLCTYFRTGLIQWIANTTTAPPTIISSPSRLRTIHMTRRMWTTIHTTRACLIGNRRRDAVLLALLQTSTPNSIQAQETKQTDSRAGFPPHSTREVGVSKTSFFMKSDARVWIRA